MKVITTTVMFTIVLILVMSFMTFAVADSEMTWKDAYFELLKDFQDYANKNPKIVTEVRSCGGGSCPSCVCECEVCESEPTIEDVQDNYGRTDCSADNNWCNTTDLNQDGNVDVFDLGIIGNEFSG